MAGSLKHHFSTFLRHVAAPSRRWTSRRAGPGEEELRAANMQLAERQRTLIETLARLHEAHRELQQAQLQLIQVAKMESIGRLAAGVAHEVKNPLATLQIGIDVLTEYFPPADKSIMLLLRDMSHAVRRADRVIKGLLDFSAPRELRLSRAHLNAVIGQALELVKHPIAKQNIIVDQNLRALPPQRMDRNKMEQVFLNLFMNALQAMPDGGTLSVRTAVMPVEALGLRYARRRGGWEPSSAEVIVAEVEDTGPGIPTERLHRVFDPFFTTKPTGEGTGLGLTVCKKIVELHGGMIALDNRPEGGVRVAVIFSAEAEKESANGKAPHPAD